MQALFLKQKRNTTILTPQLLYLKYDIKKQALLD
jgi:hypothetical protein